MANDPFGIRDLRKFFDPTNIGEEALAIRPSEECSVITTNNPLKAMETNQPERE